MIDGLIIDAFRASLISTMEGNGIAILDAQYCADDHQFIIEAICAEGMVVRKVMVNFIIFPIPPFKP